MTGRPDHDALRPDVICWGWPRPPRWRWPLPAVRSPPTRPRSSPSSRSAASRGSTPWRSASRRRARSSASNASMIGPTQADAAQQVRAVEDLIARKVDVIAVVPNDAVALEPVFKRAQEAGIKVLTHESPDQKNNDWNVELTSVEGFGETHMEALAKAMGGEGKYIVYVGSLTVPLHNKWADAAIALQKEKYPEDEAGRRPLRRRREHGRQLQDRAGPDARQPGPEGHPGVRQPGPDRRRARRRGARQGGEHRRGRAVLAGPGCEVHQVGRDPRRASSGTRCWPAR